MKNILTITKHLDMNNHWRTADVLFKIALDLSTIEDKTNNFIGAGDWGRYYSNFTPEQRAIFMNSLGHVPEDLGVKSFTAPNIKDQIRVDNQIIEENLLCSLVGPVIAAQTSFRVPSLLITTNLSYALFHKQLFTNKMPGKSLGDLRSQLLMLIDANHEEQRKYIDTLSLYILDIIDQQITDRLEDIGVIWHDAHPFNFLVSDSIYRYIIKTILDTLYIEFTEDNYMGARRQIIKYYEEHYMGDFTQGLSLFDFGGMRCISWSLAGNAIGDFINKIEPYIAQNKLIHRIYQVALSLFAI